MTNQLARQRLELFAGTDAGSVQPANSLGEGKIPNRDHFSRVHAAVIERLAKDGLI